MSEKKPDHPTIHDGEETYPTGCPRGRMDCHPLGRRASGGYASFMCCGENDGTHGGPEQDRWRFCMKSQQGVDVLVNIDERDAVDMAVVLLEGLSSEAARAVAGWPMFSHLPDPENPDE